MNLYLEATTNAPDLVIDYIEVKLKSSRTVSLNWDVSYPTRFKGFFNAIYNGVNFGEESAKGKLSELKDMQVIDVGMYSEKLKKADLSILRLTFSDNNEVLTFCNVYSVSGGDASG